MWAARDPDLQFKRRSGVSNTEAPPLEGISEQTLNHWDHHQREKSTVGAGSGRIRSDRVTGNHGNRVHTKEQSMTSDTEENYKPKRTYLIWEQAQQDSVRGTFMQFCRGKPSCKESRIKEDTRKSVLADFLLFVVAPPIRSFNPIIAPSALLP